MVCYWCRLTQVLNLFLALLLSSFSSENMKKGQQQEEDDVDNDDDDADDDDEAKPNDNQTTAAYERLQRWAKFVKARVSSLTRPREVQMDDVRNKHGGGGGLKATSTTDTACDMTVTISASASMQSPQPAVLVDCSDRQVVRCRYHMCLYYTTENICCG